MSNIIDTVIANDFCIGCGTCASFGNSPFEIRMDEDGKYRAYLKGNKEGYEYTSTLAEKICPFYTEIDENDISTEVFDADVTNLDEFIGFSLANYVGHVKEGSYREKGASGGMANWVATQLLKKKMVDGIIHVRETDNGNLLYEYKISYTVDEINKGAKSKYYPIELSKVLSLVRSTPGKYALIGIPCFIKSVRLLAMHDEIINKRIKYFIGLVCGHLKSDMFAKSIGWQLGINPDELTNIDFRKKLHNRPANSYGVEVFGSKNGNELTITSPTKDLYTTNWGHGFFKYKACEFCDDVLAETADITVGDAWLPEYSHDSLGTNVVTVRNKEILSIIQENILNGNLHLEKVDADKIYQSQAGGFRHRRDGLAYRLYLKDGNKEWRPNKRVSPSNSLSEKRKKIYNKRSEISNKSFLAYRSALKEGDFNVLIKKMDSNLIEYNRLIRPSFFKRALRKVKRETKEYFEKYK